MSNPPMPPSVAPVEPVGGRLAPGERASILWAITVAGFSVWLLIGSAYATARASTRGQSATQPTTQPLTPYETVVLSAVVSIAIAVTVLGASILLRPSGLTALGLSGRALPRGFLVGIGASLVVVPVVYVAALFTERFWDSIGLEHPNAHPLLRIMDQQQADPLLRAIVIVSAIALAPLSEELLFRGHVQTAIRYTLDSTGTRRGSARAAIFFTSLVFALFHGELWMMPPIFLLSLFLGWVYERTNNLWATIVIHACFNASSVAYFLWQLPPAHH